MDDLDIIERCLAGEMNAFELIVNKYQAGLISVAWSVLGNREDARDAVQDAFVQAFAHLRRFDRTRSFKNWLYGIAYKRCKDRKRKDKSMSKYLEAMRKENNPPDPERRSPARIEDTEMFGPLMAKLKEKERLALSLKINEGYTAAEIAEVVHCAESSVRVYIFNAIRKLRNLRARNSNV